MGLLPDVHVLPTPMRQNYVWLPQPTREQMLDRAVQVLEWQGHVDSNRARMLLDNHFDELFVQGRAGYSPDWALGLLWGAYHFSIIYWSGNPTGVLALGLLLPAQLFAWLPPCRLLMVWMYDHTNSLPLAILMHASATASMLILQPFGISGVMLLTYVLGLGVAYWIIVGVVAVATRGRFARLSPDDTTA